MPNLLASGQHQKSQNHLQRSSVYGCGSLVLLTWDINLFPTVEQKWCLFSHHSFTFDMLKYLYMSNYLLKQQCLRTAFRFTKKYRHTHIQSQPLMFGWENALVWRNQEKLCSISRPLQILLTLKIFKVCHYRASCVKKKQMHTPVPI